MFTTLCARFGLTQAELGRYLGLSKSQVWQIGRGLRPLPRPAAPTYIALAAAGQAALEPAAEAPDPAQLRRQQRAARHRAGQLAHELEQLQERSAWARRRLAALPPLTAAFTAGGAAAPPWLERFASKARNELVRSGGTVQALLRAKQAGLLAEAEALEQLLAGLPPE
ncbi:hypothetical protein [Hymenobacter sp. B81]|uniref:hypothetical protein n=1 Tax=Hymenobacter sp. B81 TaxID=3344878 RepID=UPI0037DC9331